MIDLNKEMAWITFISEGWETKWCPVIDALGNHLEFDSKEIMNICRANFKDVGFGIAPTSQMIISNSVKNNL